MNKSTKFFYQQFRDRGASYKDAIMVLSTNTEEGLRFVYQWILDVWGSSSENFRIVKQQIIHKGGNTYHVFIIELTAGQTTKVIFNISKFFGK